MTLPEILPSRPMTMTDLGAVMAIERASGSAPHWSRSEYLKLFEEDSNITFKRFGMVVEASGGLAGFAIIRMLVTEGVAEAELESIVVTPQWRGRGLGILLLADAMRRAVDLGARELNLEVRASNEAAIRLYQRATFQETGRRRGYYRDPDEDAVLMSVTL